MKEYLEQYASIEFLEREFTSNFNVDNYIFTKEEKEELSTSKNTLDKNIKLKHLLSNKIKKFQGDKEELLKIYYWIINIWGGIGRFKNNQINNSKILDFTDKLSTGKIDKNHFSVISSLSKISSFFDINSFAIYDSRVVYSLNWIILKKSLYPKIKFFPQPSGRNNDIVNYDICSLINFYYLTNNTNIMIKSLYYTNEEAYHTYCKLISEINSEIWASKESNRYPFYTEMILFSLAPKMILGEIKNEIAISFNT